MSSAVEKICADLGITIIACHESGGAYRTKSFNVLRRLLQKHGPGHLILTLRTITESAGNELMLKEPVIYAVSDILLAHRDWADLGLRWLEEFDNVNLAGLMASARANRTAVPIRASISTMLFQHLSSAFTEPPDDTPVVLPCEERAAADEARARANLRNIALGLELQALKQAAGHNQFERAAMSRFKVNAAAASELMRIAAVYGDRPEITTKVVWNVLRKLSSPSLPASVRQDMEARVLAGRPVNGAEIQAARIAHPMAAAGRWPGASEPRKAMAG